MLKIAIDDGHGKETAGKRTPIFADGIYKGTYMIENDFNEAVAKLLPSMFSKVGVQVVMVAYEEYDVPLATRVQRANDANADAYISIHANAYGDGVTFNDANGVESWIYSKANYETYNLAEKIQYQLATRTGRRDRGVKESTSLYVLSQTRMPAVLIEGGFMTNLEEAYLLLDDSYRLKCAEAVFYGVCEHFGIDTKVSEPEKEYICDCPEEIRYNTVDELPYGKDTIEKLINLGYLNGTGKGLDLSIDMVRILIILDRAGVFK